MKFKIDIKNLLEYFDLKRSSKKGDTTSIISVVGEDLNSAIFRHFREKEFKARIKVFDDIIPTIGKNAGKRLDRWIFEEEDKSRMLYQAEIKNWCARAIGGNDVPIGIDSKKLSKLIKLNWNCHFLDINENEPNGINKVFIEMKNVPKGKIFGKYRKIPLLIIWEAAHPKGKDKHYYRFKADKKYFYFDYCYIFSCSLYLRYLLRKGTPKIYIEMPNVKRRLLDMNRLFAIEK